MGLHYGSLGANDAAAHEEQRHLLLGETPEGEIQPAGCECE